MFCRRLQCFNYYSELFGCNTIDEIVSKIRRLRVETFKSRQSDARKIETKKKQLNKKAITIVQSLNDYRRAIEIGNFRTCFKCRSNFDDRAAKLVHSFDEKWGNETLVQQNLRYRRLNKIWICNGCYNEDSLRDYTENVATIPICETLTGTEITFCPDMNKEYGFFEENKNIEQNSIKIYTPSSCEALAKTEKFECSVKNNFKNVHISTYVSSLHQKLSKFALHIVFALRAVLLYFFISFFFLTTYRSQ